MGKSRQEPCSATPMREPVQDGPCTGPQQVPKPEPVAVINCIEQRQDARANVPIYEAPSLAELEAKVCTTCHSWATTVPACPCRQCCLLRLHISASPETAFRWSAGSFSASTASTTQNLIRHYPWLLFRWA